MTDASTEKLKPLWDLVELPEPTTPPDKELYLKYYLHQWDQVRHVENMRATITLQLLALAAGAAGGFFYTKDFPKLQVALGLVIVATGWIGYQMVLALEQAANVHIDRGRALRKQLAPLNTVALSLRGFYPLAKHFLRVHKLILSFGIALTVYGFARALGVNWHEIVALLK